MSNNDRAYIWAAHDYADEEIVLEKFCARFKTAEEAKKFADAFALAKIKISDKPGKAAEPKKESGSSSILTTPKVETVPTAPSSNLGGFKFISTPTFKPKEEPKPPTPKVEEVKEPVQPSPFAAFSFNTKAG